jgi:hypothetical protein
MSIAHCSSLREQNQAILDRLELTGEFWRLP